MYYLDLIIRLLASFIAVAVVLSLHEFAHAFVAYKCGDPTPKMNGRLTVNPVAHFDPLGLIMFTVAGFGWAKPVPINPYNFRHYRKGLTLTAVAGVAMNYITAFLFFPLMVLSFSVNLPWWPLEDFLYYLTSYFYGYSLGFCVFNTAAAAGRVESCGGRKQAPRKDLFFLAKIRKYHFIGIDRHTFFGRIHGQLSGAFAGRANFFVRRYIGLYHVLCDEYSRVAYPCFMGVGILNGERSCRKF